MKSNTFIGIFCFGLLTNIAIAQTNELKRGIPEQEGVHSKAIIELFDSLMTLSNTDIHSIMIVRHNKVIAELYPKPFAPEYSHTLYSCSKTFVAAAVGLAIEENRLKITDRVATYFPTILPDTISANLSKMTIRNLLTMSSGIDPDWNIRNICTDWIRTYLAKPVSQPGKTFKYDSMCTYLLSAILQKVTGMKVLDYLKQKLFIPMHIIKADWEVSPEGYNTGGWGLRLQSESLAKFGLLLMNHGKWDCKQLLPESWVQQMMTKQINNGSNGYGYQMWLCEYPNTARADGHYGQYILLVPDKDMLVVITECTTLNGAIHRNLIWKKLLPAVKDTSLKISKQYSLLQKIEHSSSLPFIKGYAKTSLTPLLFENKNIKLVPNKLGWENMHFHFTKDKLILTFKDKNGNISSYPLGFNHWEKGQINVNPPYSIEAIGRFKGISKPFNVGGCYAFSNSHCLNLKIYYLDWVSVLRISLKIEKQNVAMTVQENNGNNVIIIKGRLSNE